MEQYVLAIMNIVSASPSLDKDPKNVEPTSRVRKRAVTIPHH